MWLVHGSLCRGDRLYYYHAKFWLKCTQGKEWDTGRYCDFVGLEFSILALGPFLCLGLAAANSYLRHHQRHHHLNLFITCLVSAWTSKIQVFKACFCPSLRGWGHGRGRVLRGAWGPCSPWDTWSKVVPPDFSHVVWVLFWRQQSTCMVMTFGFGYIILVFAG